jgi:hypothetical protein
MPPWLVVEPAAGMLAAGVNDNISLMFSSLNQLPGVYEGDLVFNTNYETGPQQVHVIMTVEGFVPPVNLSGYIECTDFCLSWEMPSEADPESYNIYRDGQLIINITGGEFCDENLIPEVEYGYYVTAVYTGGESQPSPELLVTIPMPDDLEPFNAECQSSVYGNFIEWEEPVGCLQNLGYNIYKNNIQLNQIPIIETFWEDVNGVMYDEYDITAVYYFGDSEATIAWCFYDAVQYPDENKIDIYPVPSELWVVIRSPISLEYLSIYNCFGKVVKELTLSGTEHMIDLSGQPAGIYTLKIRNVDRQLILRKIIVK